MDVTVCIGTFGDEAWADLAVERAIPSVDTLGVPWVHHHGVTLHAARNGALTDVRTEWVIHLDADDELEAGYIDALDQGSCDLRAPAVRYLQDGRAAREPYVPRVAGHHHDCTADCLPEGNWLVVGTAVRADLVRQVGGWRDWAVYEDWDLWLRCWQAGATVEAIPQAVYRAHVRADSRNRAPSIREKNQVHHAIVEANLGAAA